MYMNTSPSIQGTYMYMNTLLHMKMYQHLSIYMYMYISLHFYSYPRSYTYRLIGLSPTLITCVYYHNRFDLCCPGNDTSHID